MSGMEKVGDPTYKPDQTLFYHGDDKVKNQMVRYQRVQPPKDGLPSMLIVKTLTGRVIVADASDVSEKPRIKPAEKPPPA